MVPVVSLPPVQARPLPPPDTRGVQARPGQEDAPAGSGKSFDILLAEHGSASHAALPSQDGDARQGQDTAAPTVAEMFNEHGFFANAAALHPQTQGDFASQRTGRVGVEAMPAQPAPAPVHIAPQAPSAGGPNAVPPSTASPDGLPGSGTQPRFSGSLAAPSAAQFAGSPIGLPSAPRGTTQQAPQIVAAAARAPAADARRPAASQDNPAASSRADKRLAATIEEHLRRTSANAVRVEVRAAEDGLLVTARTDKLDRAERSRLRTEIAALLSRHGHGPARIRLNGEFAPIRQV